MKKINFRIIFFCAISFMLALVFARYIFDLSIPYIIFLSLIIFALLFVCIKYKCFKRFILLFCVFVFGIGYYFLGFYTFSGIDYSQSVLIEARVESITNYTNFSTCILDDIKINGNNKSFKITATLNNDEIKQSNIIVFENKITKVQLFDDDGFKSFYYKNDTPYKTTINNVIAIKNGYKKLNEKIHDAFNNFVETHFDSDIGGVIKSVIIGDKSTLNKDIKNSFSSSGIAHLLAISGLHISIIILCINFILKKFRLKEKYNFIILLILLAFYCYICNFSPSVVRASLMSLIFIFSNVVGRKYDKLTSLSLCAILILVFKPLYIFDAGFLLSFGCVYCIFVISPSICKLLEKTKINKKICQNLSIVFSVQLGLIPLTSLFYSSTNLLSLLCNIICVPLFEFAFVLTFAILFICVILPFMSFLTKVIEFLYWLIINISVLFSNATFAFLTLPKTNSIFVIGFYSSCFYVSNFVNEKHLNKLTVCSSLLVISYVCSLFV